MQIPAGLVLNTDIGASENSPVTVDKLGHIHHHVANFDNDVDGKPRTLQISTRPKVGATAGWTLDPATDLPYLALLPASQSGSTLIVRIDGLDIGDIITGFRVIAQIESAGGAVTLDGDLRATTNVAAEPTDASIGTITQVSVTADTAVSQVKTGLAEIVTSGKSYYLKLTGTTAAATDIILQACEITVENGLVTRTQILFVARKAGTIEEVKAGFDDTGTSMGITFDVQKRPATSVLTSVISFTHADTDRVEKAGTISGTGAYAAGDVVVAIMTVTTQVGAQGPWLRVVAKDAGA